MINTIEVDKQYKISGKAVSELLVYLSDNLTIKQLNLFVETKSHLSKNLELLVPSIPDDEEQEEQEE